MGRRQTWHDIITLGQYTRSEYVGCGMQLLPLANTHSQNTLGVNAIIALGQHTPN